MIQAIADWIGLNLPDIVWSSNYNVSASTIYQIITQACCVLGVVLVITLIQFIFGSILSLARHR